MKKPKQINQWKLCYVCYFRVATEKQLQDREDKKSCPKQKMKREKR